MREEEEEEEEEKGGDGKNLGGGGTEVGGGAEAGDLYLSTGLLPRKWNTVQKVQNMRIWYVFRTKVRCNDQHRL